MIETPHLAIIHLLRAMGTCSDQQTPQPIPPALLEQKQAAEIQLSTLNYRIDGSPCAIRLEQEIFELQHLVNGLRNQNLLRKSQGWEQIQKVSNAYSTQSGDFLQQQSNKIGEQMWIHRSQQRRLQEEYQLMMMKIKKLHEWNEGIINSYGKQRWQRM